MSSEPDMLRKALLYAEQLSEGIDPTSGGRLTGAFASEQRMQRYFLYIKDILQQRLAAMEKQENPTGDAICTAYIDAGIKTDWFRECFGTAVGALSYDGLTLLELISRINSGLRKAAHPNLEEKDVEGWLYRQDYLIDNPLHPTDTGADIGLLLEVDEQKKRRLVFTYSAQMFIVDHLTEIFGYQSEREQREYYCQFCQKPKEKPTTKPASSGKRWTRKADKQIAELFYNGVRGDAIAQLSGRTKQAVAARLVRLGVIKDRCELL